MSLSNALRRTANKLVKQFGGEITIQSVSLGEYNAMTGTAEETIESNAVSGVFEDVNASEVNDLVRGDDRKLLVAAAELPGAPSLRDKVFVENVTYQIVQIKTIEQANEPIVYQLFLRA